MWLNLFFAFLKFGLKIAGEQAFKRMLDAVAIWYVDYIKEPSIKLQVRDEMKNLDLEARAMAIKRKEFLDDT